MTDQKQQSLLLGKIAAYTEILVKDPSSTIFVSLAETYRKMGMFEDARQIISKGLILHPDFSPAYIVMARILCQLDDYDGSVTAFERALKLDNDSLAALVGYARVQILLGDEAVARELLLRARYLSPADPIINKLLLSLPEETEVKGIELEEAVAQDELDGGNSSALVSSTLADLYLAQGLPEKALDLFRKLSMQNPDDLTLRRRVRELEHHLQDNDQNVVASADISQPEKEDVAVLSENSPVDDVVELPQLQDSESEDIISETVFVTLNRWLSNIQRRRENV